MRYGIEFFCGTKFGGWRLGMVRYPDAEAAKAAAQAQAVAETRDNLFPLLRRVVPV